MKAKNAYLIIAILGTLIPLNQLYTFIMQNGFHPEQIILETFANPMAGFFAWDVIISTFAVIGFILVEGRRLNIPNRWVFILMNLIIGVSLALPAFLWAREVHLEKQANHQSQ
ncbi:MAG: DUF2834 domain-containing protein [Bacteroidota bacterium]|nr:DUF2834 domain-containing protein [Bacteroidota bacterium]MDX5428151.1 DUF2834 domain-containing protein [Bacteroidota bacterium]MDX5505954.1 DUF2834 domain-containing protein [Bacteroidota bacterium]